MADRTDFPLKCDEPFFALYLPQDVVALQTIDELWARNVGVIVALDGLDLQVAVLFLGIRRIQWFHVLSVIAGAIKGRP